MNIKNPGLKTKLKFMNMGILIPIVFFICFIIVENLSKNIINSSITYLLKESKTTQINVIGELEKSSELDKKNLFHKISPFIVEDLSSALNMRIQTYDEKGQIIYDSSKNVLSLYDKDVFNAVEGKKAYIVKKIDGKTYIMLSSPIFINKKIIGCVRYIYIEEKGYKLINNMILMIIIIVSISIVIAWILTNLFSIRIVKPITDLKILSEKVAQGNYDQIINIDSKDEIEDLAQTFNKMSKSIENNILKLKKEKSKQKDFFDNVTHEFKTPLTAIIGFSDIIPKLKDKDEILNSLTYINKEGTRLLNLVEELLLLSKLGRSEFNIDIKEVDIKKIMEEALKIMHIRLNNYKIQVINNIKSQYVQADFNKTKEVILNILDNAIKYSNCNTISFNMYLEDEYLHLIISDDGIGIEEKFLSKLLEPFSRVNNDVSNTRSGSGIGLSICKEIMKKQSGSIEIASKPENGTKVILILKLSVN